LWVAHSLSRHIFILLDVYLVRDTLASYSN
jgi:hypothetical protein